MERVAREQPKNLCRARLPGFIVRADLNIDSSTVLLATPRTNDEHREEDSWLYPLFKRRLKEGRPH